MAATTRTITDTIYKLDGTPWQGATLTVERVDRPMIDSDGTVADTVATATTDANGAVSLVVAVPPSGAGRYRLRRPVETGQPADLTYFYMGAGDALTVGEILAGSASALTEDAVLTLMNAYLSKADNLASLASAATARTNLGLGTAATAAAGDFEAALGDPAADGYVLASTAAGVRSWVEQSGGGGASDVGDLTTTGGSSSNMLRVAAAGGLEYRTVAQVLADLGAAPTASPTFTGTLSMAAATVTGNVTVTNTVGLRPDSNTTSWPLVQNAAGAAVVTVNTTAKKIAVESLSIAYDRIHQTGGAALFLIVYDTFIVNTATGNILSVKANKIGMGAGNILPTAIADIAASTTSAASLRLRSGTAPTSPNAGDIWFDGTNLKMYDGTTTRTISWT